MLGREALVLPRDQLAQPRGTEVVSVRQQHAGHEGADEQDPADAVDEPRERLPPRCERTQAQIDAFEPQQVEGHERACAPPAWS